jgi:hypothetical protein
LYGAGSLVTASKELSTYRLDLVGVQEVRWEGGGTETAKGYRFFYGKGNENHELGAGFSFVHKKIISAVEFEVEFVSDRMSYIIQRGCWCHIIVLIIPQQKIKLMMRRTASTRNWNVYLIISLNTI